MRNKFIFLTAVLLCGLVYACILLFYNAEKNPVHIVQQKPNATADVNSVVASKELSAPVAVDRKPLTVPSLSQELGSAENLRLFAEKAKKFPEKGGYGYALMAVTSCAYMRKLIPKGHSSLKYDPTWQAGSYADRQKMIENILHKCASFSDEELSEKSIQILSQEGKIKNDLHDVVRTFAQTVTPTKPEEYKSAKEKLLQYLFDSQDPYAVSAFGMKGAVYSENNILHYAINNQVFTSPTDTRMIWGAWTMAACYLGGDCSYSSGMVQEYCLVYGRCFSDIPALVKDELYSNGDRDGSQFEKAQALAVQIADGIRRKDPIVYQPPKR